MDDIIYYRKMTSDESGAIAIFHLYGGEAQLSSRVDILLRAKSGVLPGSPLELHELRYGWLYPPSGSEAVDEVMLAKPLDGIRVLMTHGGGMVTGTVGETCRACGFVHYTNGVTDGASGIVDQLEDPILSHCLTEAQAAAVLRWRSGGEAPSPGLLATHRVVLAGPPNAGKSSLLNQLSGYDRAFVHPEAGATRDVVDELVEVGGYALWVGDLPGFSEAVASRDHLAGQAWRRAAERLIHSEMVWFVVDASQPWEGETEDAARIVADILAEAETPPTVLVVANKADLPSAWDGEPWRDVFPSAEGVWLSSLPQGDAIAVLGTKASTLW